MKLGLVTTLKWQATRILADLHDSKEPVFITEHGKPSACLVDVADFEYMQNRLQILDGIARGESATNENGATSHSDAKKAM